MLAISILEILKNIILSIYIKDSNIIIFLSNIYFYIQLFNQYKNESTISIYNILTTEYKDSVSINYNFNLHIISFQKFEKIYDNNELKNLFNKKINLFENICEIIKTTKELKIYIKEIEKMQINNKVINYINDIIKQNDINNKDSKILNIYSSIGNYLIELDFEYHDNIFTCDSNKLINYICFINYLFKHGIDISKNIKMTDILYDENFNDTNKLSYDMVIGDLQDNIKNIIHADCCNNIKQLKIRGTKAEPLIIQLVTTILKRNGIAILIMPDNTLSSTSIQHINTRKYLINEFNVTNVISLENKRSLVVFKNDGKTKNINLSSFVNDNKLNISYSDIEKNNYSFYYNNYIISIDNIKNNKIFIDNVTKLKNIINIYTPLEYDNNKDNNKDNNDVLISYKYNQLKIVKYDMNNNYNNIFIIKQNIDITTQKYMNHYLNYLIVKNFDSLIKGKIGQLDIDKINELKINIPLLKIQENILSYIDTNNTIIEKNKLQIQTLINTKNYLITDLILYLPTKKLSEICTISDKSIEKNTIMILKNSNSAGSVDLTMNDKDESPNIYYLTNIKNYDKECLYNILKFHEDNLKKMANITNTVKLGLNKLETFEVPILDDCNKNVLLQYLKIYDNIKNLNEQNSLLLKLNLFNIINL